MRHVTRFLFRSLFGSLILLCGRFFGTIRLGVPKPGCFKPGRLQFLRGSALLHSCAPFCALLRSCVCALLRSFARICVFLRPTAFITTAFGICRPFGQYLRI